MDCCDKKQIIKLIKAKVVPALGCTEPIAVALATAKAKETLNSHAERIEIFVSDNIYKNGMGVIVPGTNIPGLDIAAALGAIGGKSNLNLEVLKNISKDDILKAKKLIKDKRVIVKTKPVAEKLYVESICYNEKNKARVIIKNNHANITNIQYNEKIILEKEDENIVNSNNNNSPELSVKKIYEFATQVPVNDVKFILEAAEMNKRISEEGLKGDYGLKIGKKLSKNIKKGLLSDSILLSAIIRTAAATDARMAGYKLPVMSNSGSGNQGITSTMPVIAVAEKLNVDEEKYIRALILSSLITIHIKNYLGPLSALCGCVVAATGSAAGITYLFDGNYNNIVIAIKNMIADITGMICDGAKPGCALKVASGTYSAFQAAILAIEDIVPPDNNGIVEEDVEQTIKNLANIGAKGMEKTDKLILDIMLKANSNKN
ncbi:MAG: serine dehydratase subunit alpha family protein [Bacteroidales bacterium]|nr:serine dehydratase subunit alpha family protein [Bacteroidales bacterium]